MKRVAVTGASGFIGRHVVEHLTSRGDQAIPIARPYDKAALVRTFEGLDAVVHLAGVIASINERDFHDANVEATRLVAEAARDAGTQLVHISSLAAAGPAPPSAPRSEDDPPSPMNVYGRTKLEGEGAIRSMAGLRWIILRPGVVYGPGDRGIRPLFKYARRGVIPIVGNPEGAYTFIYVEDAVRTILAAVDSHLDREVIFLGHRESVTTRGLMEAIRDAAGSAALLIEVPRAVVRIAASAGDVVGAITERPAVINSRRFKELYSTGFVCRVDRMNQRLGIVAGIGLHEGLVLARDWYLS